MNAVAECTVPEKILLAVYQLEEQGQSPFSAESLVVAAWQKFPRTFGLKGYADLYPDSNKVLTSIMGEKGLTRRGWLAKMGQKLYTLTREGKQAVRIIHGFGTGRLRQAIREHLRKHPAVKSWRPGAENEGGDGATVAVLDA